MKLSRWKDIAEIVALTAVVGGLVAVVIELRQTQVALRAQAYQARALDVISTMRESYTNPDLEVLLNDYFGNKLTVETASPQELSQIRSHLYIRRTDTDNEHYQYQNGFLDPDFYHTTTEREIKAFAPHWRAFGIPEPRQQFAAEVDRILGDPAIKSSLE